MVAVFATPDSAWMRRVAEALEEMVRNRLKQHHPRFSGVAVSVKLSTGRSFSLKIENKGKGKPFNEDGCAILRCFFTGDFQERARGLLLERLGWEKVRVHTTLGERSGLAWTWYVSCRDEEVEHEPSREHGRQVATGTYGAKQRVGSSYVR